MRPSENQDPVRQAVSECLEGIIDPCSAASGAPAGLVSMGLVGPITVQRDSEGTSVQVTLYITEPGCLMGTLFQLTAQRELAKIPGVHRVDVRMDYAHVWGPEQMSLEYRQRLAKARACRAAQMAAFRHEQDA
jgi:metal-sulfur cluster biosynthetic enzyme